MALDHQAALGCGPGAVTFLPIQYMESSWPAMGTCLAGTALELRLPQLLKSTSPPATCVLEYTWRTHFERPLVPCYRERGR